MRYQTIINLLTGLVCAVVLSACSFPPPTQYSYIPPKSYAGKRCISRCISSNNICHIQCQRRNDDLAIQRQVAEAKIDRQESRDHRHHKNKNNDDSQYENARFALEVNTMPSSCGCMNSFQMCYRTCGGNVLAFGGGHAQAMDSMLDIPDGSYQATCRQCSFNGTVLKCQCMNENKMPVNSKLNLSKTACRKILNDNGRLIAVCSK